MSNHSNIPTPESMYSTCNQICANPQTLINEIICRQSHNYPQTWNNCPSPNKPQTPPSGSKTYDCKNKEDCCRGKHSIEYSRKRVGINIPAQMKVNGILSVPETLIPASVLSNIHNPWLFLIAPHDAQGRSPSPGGTLLVNNIQQFQNGGLAIYTSQWNTIRWPFFDIYQRTWVTDSNVCDRDWCPWSKTCTDTTTSITDYCAGLDSNGHPRLNTDVNCQAWCDKQNYLGSCGTAAAIFCRKNPQHPACKCQTFTQTDAYKKIKNAFSAVPGCNACKVIPPPVCWAAPCTQEDSRDPDRRILTTQERVTANSCKGLNLTFCNQILEFEKIHGKINIDKNTFTQICGNTGPTPSPSPNSSNKKSINSLIIVFIVLLLLILVL